jgi:predicted peptidase
MKKHFIITLLLVLPLAGFIFCSTPISQYFEKRIFVDPKGGKLPYRFLQPLKMEKGRKYPLVLFLHGAGERGNDDSIQLRNGVQLFVKPEVREQFPCYMLVPQCPSDLKWVDTDWHLDKHLMPDTLSFPLRLVVALLNKTIREYPIDTTRIYLTGISMGGFGVWDLLQRFPNKFAAAAPVCGGADETKAELLKNIPIWDFQGGNDKLVKTIRSRNIIAAIRAAGGHPIYTEYAGMGHHCWDSAYGDLKIPKWMFAQHLNANK